MNIKKRKSALQDDSVKKVKVDIEIDDVVQNFSAANFRHKFFRNDITTTDLQYFNEIATSNPKCVTELLESGIKFKEIFSVLESINSDDVERISEMFLLLHFILLETVNHGSKYTENASKCCRKLLIENKTNILNMFKSENRSLVRVGFKLLKSMIVADPECGRNVLFLLDLCVNDLKLNRDRENCNDLESVRSVFIDFTLTCLIDTDISLVRSWLSRNTLVYPFVLNLVYDKYENAVLVLKTLSKYLVENTELDRYQIKTSFNIDILKALVNLYEWEGPSKNYFSDEHKTVVMKAAKELLVPILTSKKKGMVINALLHSKIHTKQKHILLHMKSCRMNSFQEELILKVFETCPDVTPAVLENYGNLLKSKSLRWDFVVKLLLEIITKSNPVDVIDNLINADAKYISTYITNSTLPRSVLEYIDERTLMSQETYIVKDCLHLMLTMLKQCQKYVIEVPRLHHLSQFDLKKIKFDAINRMLALFPSLDVIMKALSKYIDVVKENSADVIEYAMDILLICFTTFPSLIEASSFVMTYKNILMPIYKFKKCRGSFVNAEFKAIKVVLALEPQSISLESELFEPVLKSIINVFIFGSSEYQLEANELLISIFKNTNLFENNTIEAEIWIQSFKLVDQKIIPEITQFLVQNFVDASKNINNIRLKSHNLINETFVKFTNINEMFNSLDVTEITQEENFEVPVVDNLFIQVFSENSNIAILPYLENVALQYFHYLPHPEIIQNIVSETVTSLNKYFKNWVVKNKVTILDYSSHPAMSKFTQFLVQKVSNVEEIFPNGIENGTQTLFYIQTTIFYISQLIRLEQFDQDYMKTACYYLKAFFNELKDNQSKHEEALKYIFCNHHNLFENFTIKQDSKTKELTTSFLLEIGSNLKQFTSFNKYTSYYSNKIVNEITNSSTSQQNIVKLLEIFELTDKDFVKLLKHYSNQPHTMFINEQNEKTYHYNLLVFGLLKLAEKKSLSLDGDTIEKISQIYINSIRENRNELNLDTFEANLCEYLSRFSHNIQNVHDNMLSAIFETKRIAKTTIKLGVFLVSRTDKYDVDFLKLVKTNITKKELVFPLTNVALQKNLLQDKQLLAAIYNEYKNGISKTIEKPQKAAVIYKENTFCGQKLIELCMPSNECVDFAKKKTKIDTMEIYQLKLIAEIFNKAFESAFADQITQAMIYKNYFTILLQFFGILFKSENPTASMDKLNYLILATNEWVKKLNSNGKLQEVEYKDIYQSSFFNSFCKSCLKYGINKQRMENKYYLEDKYEVLLKIMGVLCNLFYKSDSNNEDAANFFNLALAHSQFFDVILTQFGFKVKASLVYLLYVLISKNKQVMDKKHVPVFLGAYGATLTDIDQYILAILQFYERNGVQMHEFRPFLWGEAAIKHYALGDDTVTNHLFRVDNMQILNIISKEMVANTLKHFPIWRRLDACSQLPKISFDSLNENPTTSSYTPTTVIEEIVERNKPVEKYVLETSGVKVNLHSSIYDPAFFISVMGLVFAPEGHDLSTKVAERNCFSLIFACLASSDYNMRAAAGVVLQRSKTQFQIGRKLLDVKLWLHLYNAVQTGLASLTTSRDAKAKKIPKPLFIATLFVGECLNILPETLNVLYPMLTNYLLITRNFNFQAVPNFITLFHSSDVKSNEHRQFIMEILCNGIKTHNEFYIVNSTNTLQSLLSFYNSPLSNRTLNILIINTINNIVKIPKSCEVMINKSGFLSWLNQSLDSVESFHFDTIDAFLNVISNTWYSIKIMQNEYNMGNINRNFLLLILKILPLLSTRSTIKTLTKFLNILEKTTISNPSNLLVINETLLNSMLAYFEQLFTDHFWEIIYIKENGSANCESSDLLREKLVSQNLDPKTIYIIVTLRNFLINWQSRTSRI